MTKIVAQATRLSQKTELSVVEWKQLLTGSQVSNWVETQLPSNSIIFYHSIGARKVELGLWKWEMGWK